MVGVELCDNVICVYIVLAHLKTSWKCMHSIYLTLIQQPMHYIYMKLSMHCTSKTHTIMYFVGPCPQNVCHESYRCMYNVIIYILYMLC